MELAFAALQQLCAPMLDRLDRLPAPQQDALGVAFGLRRGECAGSVSGGVGGPEFAWLRRPRSSRLCVWLMTRSGLIAPRRRRSCS